MDSLVAELKNHLKYQLPLLLAQSGKNTIFIYMIILLAIVIYSYYDKILIGNFRKKKKFFISDGNDFIEFIGEFFQNKISISTFLDDKKENNIQLGDLLGKKSIEYPFAIRFE